MPDWIERLRKLGWFVVEASFLVIVLCVLLDIIVGAIGFTFITMVAGNARVFLQSVPPGTTLGVVILIFLYWFIRTKK